ncbi:MAG: HAD-IC family P-type ATPase, partial [Burkholderiales bacterium]|nr:HAD-IC family P-type ATPase [Burkholderiales bacterium]
MQELIISTFKETFREPMFLLLLACSGLYFALGDPVEAMFMLAAVLFVIAMTAWQEWRTGKAMQALRDLAAPHARVLRNGSVMKILASEVQVGDTLLLESGDRISADAILVAGSVATDESLLTGESVPIDKKPVEQDPVLSSLANNLLQDNISKVFASTFVVRGNGRALVLSTGKDTAIGKVAGTLMSLEEQPSLMQRSLRRLVRIIGTLAIFFAIVEVLLNVYVDQRSWLESSLSGLTLAMAMLPEEIPVIWTVFLALGAWRISRHQVLTRRASAVESLGAITYLAVDKTGTLTENRMALVHVGNQSTQFAIVAGETDKASMPLEMESVLFHAVRASSATPVDPMEKALLLHMPASMTSDSPEKLQTPTHECAFSAEFPAMAMAYTDENPETLTWSCKGAPEAIFELCRLPEVQRPVWNAEIQRMAQLGWRVLAVASATARNTGDTLMRLNTQTGSWPRKVTDLNFKLIG